ncbi:MAG: phage terminase large subunit [Magnetococcales bacterium]|nr:phage terminase large subunit [Magnetococcales bacterium]
MTGKAFLSGMDRFAAEYRRKIEADVSGFASDPVASARRRKQTEQSLAFFAKTYFPHFVTSHQSLLHDWLFDRLPRLGQTKGAGAHLAVAAPRGEAKSTLCSRIFILWRVVTGRSRYALIIMDAYEQAATMLETIKAELEENPRLAMDFPKACGPGAVWREDVIVTTGNTKIQAFGSGKRMRGLSHGPNRPDLVICDDLENDENVRSRIQRDKLESWFKNAVLKLGPPDDSMSVVVIGTVLHHDSLLSRLLRDSMWETKRFAAIVRWPDRMDLWEQWEERLRSDGEAAADLFFQHQRKAMTAGAVVSWPGVRPIEALMKIRVRDGVNSFDSELQNAPLSENATFANLQFWHEPKPDWLYFGAVDPSMGKSGGRGDPSAILVGGLDGSTGKLSVVEADIQQRTPDRIIDRVIQLQRQYACLVWAVETVQFQEFFKDELVRRSAKAGLPVPARGVKPTTDKVLRISSLQPHVANGLILFHPKQTILLEQMRHWGESDSHDDGPDALHMLWVTAIAGRGTIGFRSCGARASAEESPLIFPDKGGWGATGERVKCEGFLND